MTRTRPFAAAAALALIAAAAPARTLEPRDLIGVRDKALRILKNHDLETAIAKLGEPETGALALEGPGLHTWGFKGRGVILWDHSGQSRQGMDISNLTGMHGTPIIKSVKTGVEAGKDLIKWTDALPHPVTGKVETSYVSCATFAPKKYVCAMAWVQK